MADGPSRSWVLLRKLNSAESLRRVRRQRARVLGEIDLAAGRRLRRGEELPLGLEELRDEATSRGRQDELEVTVAVGPGRAHRLDHPALAADHAHEQAA